MVKPKQRHVPFAADESKQIGGVSEVDPLDHGDWTLVKKQRVTIIIPALPVKVQPTFPVAEENHLQHMPGKRNSQSQCPLLTPSPGQLLVHHKSKSVTVSPEHAIPSTRTVHPPEQNLSPQNSSSPTRRILLDDSPYHRFGDNTNAGDRIQDGTDHPRPLRARKEPRWHRDYVTAQLEAHIATGKIPTLSAHAISVMPDQRLRASYLEKKLNKAGGLENWLVSLGVSRFINIFQRKHISKFHLANLNMKKLKDMGADAVGPRRKLLHAIECLCEPHCFLHARV